MNYQLILSLVLCFTSKALAVESVQFTNKELGAVYTLMRPELNSIELNGRKLVFNPSPSIRYLGVENTEMPLDLTVIANIVDLEFNHLKAKTPVITIRNGSIEVTVPVEDRVRAVQSNLGSISFKDVALKTTVGWNTRPNGVQELVVLSTVFEGSLKGSGVLSSNFILRKTRDLCVSLLTKALRKFLATEKFQNAVATGLIEYGKFYSGVEVKELSPNSMRFVENALQYEVH